MLSLSHMLLYLVNSKEIHDIYLYSYEPQFTVNKTKIKVKVSFDGVVSRTAQIALRFTSLAYLFNLTPSQLLWEAVFLNYLVHSHVKLI